MRAPCLWVLPLLAAWFSCGNPSAVVVASFPADAGDDSAAAGAAAADSGSSPVQVATPRGRVRILDGKLITDLGTPLRGAVLAPDTGSGVLNDFGMLTRIARDTGLNTVHVYLENSSLDTGSRESAGDALVSLAAQSGLYVILGFGTGVKVGQFDAEKVKAFWTLYAPRYASSTHVLFEVQNNPELTCDQPFSEATLTLERDTYSLIRSLAPDSHILLFSSTGIPQPSVFTDAVTRLGSSVSFANASFALTMAANCLALSDLPQLTVAAAGAHVPLFMALLPSTSWAPALQASENAGLGWVQYNWFATMQDIPSFISAIQGAGVSWCPDRGSFPENAATCSAAP